MRTTFLVRFLPLAAVLSVAVKAMAREAPIPYHLENYALSSGRHNGLKGPAADTVTAFREVVSVPNAPWLQLHFAKYNLGEKSYLTITSQQDGHSQRFDATSLGEWANASAYFNGDALDLELHVAPGEENVFIDVDEVRVGEWVGGRDELDTLCGTDTRVSSPDRAVGRIVPVGCTGWIVSNGAHLAAGHCNNGQMTTLQFNIPPSLPDGTIVNPPPEDQYAIVAASITFANGGQGSDWAVYNVSPNANTRLLPVAAQGVFYRMSRDSSPSTLRVTGCGVAPGVRNQTLETATGPNQGETVSSPCSARFDYRVDTEGGNSGSPVIINGTGVTVGIHTHGGCSASGGANSGTSFKNTCLQTAVNAFGGGNARYVDANHPTVIQEGSAFRPFRAVLGGVTAVPDGGIVSIVAGSYNETVIVNRPMTLTAPVGLVTITGL